MRISDALRGVTKIGVDTSALVDLVTSHERSALAWSRILPRVESGEISLVSSCFMVAEALVTAYVIPADQAEIQQAIARVERVPLTDDVAILTAEIGIAYHLDTSDAVHIATALLSGCEAFLTADSDFLRVRGYPLPWAPERVLRVILAQELSA